MTDDTPKIDDAGLDEYRRQHFGMQLMPDPHDPRQQLWELRVTTNGRDWWGTSLLPEEWRQVLPLLQQAFGERG